MFRSNPVLWPKPPVIWSFGIAVLSVTTALILTQLPALHLEAAPVSLFLFAVMFSAWVGGVAPGLLATALSALAFYYYFLSPMHSLVAKPEEIPRFIALAVSLLFAGLLSAAQRRATESLRRARDDLVGTVQQLQRTNEALQAESRERKRAEEKLQQSEAYLSEAQRLSHTGSFGWRVATGEIVWSEETFRIFGYDKAPFVTIDTVLQRIHPDDRARAQQTIDRASGDGNDFDHGYQLLMPDGSIKHVHAMAHAVKDASDGIEFVGAVTDITARKRAEEELHEAQANLANVTRVMALGELAASIAHEVNQPLAAVVANAAACLRWLDRETPNLEEARGTVPERRREQPRLAPRSAARSTTAPRCGCRRRAAPWGTLQRDERKTPSRCVPPAAGC